MARQPTPIKTGAASTLPRNHPARVSAPKQSAAPVPTPDKGKGTSGPASKGPSSVPTPAGFAMRMGKGVAHAGKGAASNSGGITAIMAATFAIVAIAKFRGTANISTSHALFGGFILLFLLTLLYKFAPGVAMGFAVLVLITALLDYGVDAFNGLFGKGSGIPAPIVTGVNQNVPAGLQGAIGGDINSHPDSYAPTAGTNTGISSLPTHIGP